MKSPIAFEEEKLKKIVTSIPHLKSEIDRHKILYELRDFGLQCLVEAVRAANLKDYDRAASFDQFSYRVREARKAAANFEIEGSNKLSKPPIPKKPLSDFAEK